MSDEAVSPRVQPFYCPYCAEENFVPSGALDGPPGEYHCRSCDRRYRVRYLGSGGDAGTGTSPAPGSPATTQEAATSWDSTTP